jgi:hypothetical protein
LTLTFFHALIFQWVLHFWTATRRTFQPAFTRVAPSLVGHPVDVIETRLKEEEDEVLKQLHTLNERMDQWETTVTN